MVIALKIGDIVVCKVKGAAIVESFAEFDEIKLFEIIAFNYQGWHIYIPSYIVIKNSILITHKNHKSLGIDKRFIDGEALFITSSFIVKIDKVLEGMICDRCNEWFEFAEPNQENGSMLCWLCRNYRHYN
jgi:hypothetical protein